MGSDTSSTKPEVTFRAPTLADGATFWRLAKESGTLDLNSEYAYVMWCGQFSGASVVAEVDGEPAGFVMGFRPPETPEALFVWQVAVSSEHRGLGIAGRMIDSIVRRAGLTAVQATVTPSNDASMALFRGIAKRAGAECRETPYIESEHFPTEGHEPEVLFHIAPIQHDQ